MNLMIFAPRFSFTTLVSIGLTLLIIAGSQAALAGPTPARVVTMTYLKSEPGKLDQLELYVRSNWFVMDAEAVRQGLFVSYEWLDTGSDDGAWNALVMVTYNDERGFAGIEQRWAAIKAAHKEVRINGAGMRELGRVLETKTLFEREPFLAKSTQTAKSGDATAGLNPPTQSAMDMTDARQAVENYFRAADSGDPEKVRNTFLPSGRFEGVGEGKLISMSAEEFAAKNFTGQPPGYVNNVNRTTEWVNVSGPVAIARVKVEIGAAAYFDHFILYRVNGAWKIGVKASASPEADR